MEQLEEDVKIGYGMVQRWGEDIIKLNLVINDLKKDHLEKDEMIKEFQKKEAQVCTGSCDDYCGT